MPLFPVVASKVLLRLLQGSTDAPFIIIDDRRTSNASAPGWVMSFVVGSYRYCFRVILSVNPQYSNVNWLATCAISSRGDFMSILTSSPAREWPPAEARAPETCPPGVSWDPVPRPPWPLRLPRVLAFRRALPAPSLPELWGTPGTDRGRRCCVPGRSVGCSRSVVCRGAISKSASRKAGCVL